MDHDPSTSEQRSFVSGMRTAVVVVVLCTLAVVADHAFFVAPHAVSQAAASVAPPAAIVVSDDPLPPDLHPTAADIEAPPATF